MKKIGSVFIFLFLICSFCFCVQAEETAVAQDLTKKECFRMISGSGSVSRLIDRSVKSACSAEDFFEMQITSETPLYGIYLIWNHTPPQWTLTGVDDVTEGGEYGFWHEYKPLNGGTDYLLTWEGEGYLADVYLLGAGELPDYVQVWEPPCEKADFLLLPTHADDEHLWFGGTMPYYAGELGYKIQVVYLMKHVYGRHHELINGLWTVGVRNYPVISEFEDKYCANLAQAQSYYPEEEVLEFLVENIRRFRPEVIIGHDLDGEYGHGAHILNAKVLSEQALQVAADTERFAESAGQYGTWETKKCYLHLYTENEIFINWQEKILTAFDGKNAYEMAQAGFDQHVSQRTFFSMSLDDRARYGNGLFGLCHTTVGPDLQKDDFLENIPAECLTTWVEPEPEISTDTQVNTESFIDTESDENSRGSLTVFVSMISILVLLCICGLISYFVFSLALKKGRRN